MHDEPTTHGGDYNWEQRQREKINLRLVSPPVSRRPRRVWWKWVAPVLIVGTIIGWAFIIWALSSIWSWIRG